MRKEFEWSKTLDWFYLYLDVMIWRLNAFESVAASHLFVIIDVRVVAIAHDYRMNKIFFDFEEIVFSDFMSFVT